MRKLALPLALLLTAAAAPPSELPRLRAEAARATITRDDWGIAHVHGVTDADAVLGMIYAQAEDDFPRIEANYLTSLGLTAEAEGEKAIWQDLRARLYVSPTELKADYAKSPPQMRKLMNAWADGLNYFLATHPEVHPRVIRHFEPWMVMSFTEGSIGGDIERIDLDRLEAFYGKGPTKLASAENDNEPRGSNGIAISPKLTADGGALLLGDQLEVAEHLLDRLVGPLGPLECGVRVVHVRLVVPVVMDLHRLRVDVRLERIEGIRKLR